MTRHTRLTLAIAALLLGLAYVRVEHFSGGLNPSGQPLFTAIAALAPLTMFAYLGLESATVPAGDVVNPARTIPQSTMLGIAVAGALYVLGTFVVLGIVPREQLVSSAAPFADAMMVSARGSRFWLSMSMRARSGCA